MFPLSYNLVFVTFLTVISSLSLPDFQCTLGDNECIKNILNEVTPHIIAGDPSTGIPVADPLKQKIIHGNMGTLNFTFRDTITEGFKSCTYENVFSDPETLTLDFDMMCPKFLMYGNYEINGRLLLFPVTGKGKYEIVSGLYSSKMTLQFERVLGSEGKYHWYIRHFNFLIEPLEPIDFNFSNLFGGDKTMSDFIHKFAHENWKEVSQLFQNPIFETNMKSIVNNVNNVLLTIPMENLTI